ncbi:radical SAM family protein [Tumebacillus sp. BK434]|uniref:radical SAM protein n=1 Tax=Tumebacillus sp. BK434 TaxID=2512169 RepID=UPI0010539B00|nr:radical SAM protein [Tumebacillus sp. BK434]TCP57702.1 radical SAM family protein [Tumebacillus sp. BK434]
MHLVYADKKGQIYDHPDLLALGRNGEFLTDIYEEELIPLPDGATLVSLPGTKALGFDPETGKTISLPGEEYTAVGALLPQGFTRLLLPGYAKADDAEPFPLFGYTAVVWKDDSFYVAADATDDPYRWNPMIFPDAQVEQKVQEITTLYPDNRIWKHLTNCALGYGCLTSRNTFLERWEGALPVSSTCNAGCVGCISEQPDDSPFPSPQVRMDFKPTVEEMVELMLHHLKASDDAIISFGQGCEGEPSTRGVDIAEAIRRVRAETGRGFININTNAGLVDMIKLITDAGLDLMRVSTISALDDHYNAYYRPRLYGVEHVGRSLKYAADKGVYTSINYLIFPGVTDREEEIEAMVDFINQNDVKLIQMRNLNIDPELYLGTIPKAKGDLLGMKTMLDIFKSECPNTVIGSYTHVPPSEFRNTIKKP